MKTIWKIAKTELQTLFYSPIAWLILIIFTFQASLVFINCLDGLVMNQALQYGNNGVTQGLFGGWQGLFVIIQGYLYLYMPLLTMNLMSREYSSGSIKLLYSSPVTDRQIIFGKYLSMMIYALLLTAILFLYVVYALFVVKDLDIPLVLTGLLGVYLLTCAYAAIGLFMSSLTSYQVVAAVGTLVMLSLLNYVKGWWQDVAFVRDLTYWLAITGRSDQFVSGMLCSEDILYFITVIGLFLSMTILHLQSKRQRMTWVTSTGRYVAVWLVVFAVGYLSSRPALMGYYDATRTKQNTLTPNSQEIIQQMEGGLKITTYVNLLDKYFWIGLPARVNEDLESFEKYVRFKPEIEMEYVYYYDQASNESFDNRFPNLTLEEKAQKMIEINKLDAEMFLTPEQIKQEINLQGENNRFVRVLEREDGRKTFLRVFDDNMIFPTETEITAACKRIVMDLPKVGFLTGHDERNTTGIGDRDYSFFTQFKTFRHSLLNQGFDFEDMTLLEPVDDKISILVIAEMKSPLTEVEQQNLDRYIAKGGNLIIIGEPGRQQVMNEVVAPLGVQFMEGMLVNPTADHPADLIIGQPTQYATQISYMFDNLKAYGYGIAMPNTTGLSYVDNCGFDIQPLLVSNDKGSWNELNTTDFVDEKVTVDTSLNEKEQSYPTALALTRAISDKEQKIVVVGDADCFSNGELMRSRSGINAFNYYLISGLFDWLSDGEVPIDVRRPKLIDDEVYMEDKGVQITKMLLLWLLPISMLLLSVVIWLRRRGK